MKILHLLVSDSFSGAENVAISICKNLSEEYDFAYASKDGKIKETLETNEVKYHLVDKMNLKAVKKIIKEEQPDIIHAHDYYASTFAALSGFEGKIIAHIHNNWPFAKKWNKYTFIFRVVCRKFDKIIFVSKTAFNEAVYKKYVEEKAIILPNVVDRAKIEKLSKEKNKFGSFDIGFIGRITEQKDPERFISLIEQISKRQKIKAVMIGDGSAVDTRGLNIKMTGYLKNPFCVLKDCKCIIMPSRWEGFGLTAIECLVLGVPVYNSGVGGLSEVFGNNSEFICKTDKEYIEKVIACLNNPKPVKIDLERYIDKKMYYKKIKEIYES